MRAGEVLLGPLSLDASSTSPEPWSPTPNWAGEAGFAWHDVLHACLAVIRYKPWQALRVASANNSK